MYRQEPFFATQELSDMCHIILEIVVSFVRKCRKPFLQVKAEGVFSKDSATARHESYPVWSKRCSSSLAQTRDDGELWRENYTHAP